MNAPINYSMLESIVGGNAEKIAYIDFKLRFSGIIKRSDLHIEYGLSDTSASKLLSTYSELRPGNFEYDRSRKMNVINCDVYSPLIAVDMDTALGMLAHGFNKNKLANNPVLPYSKIGAISNPINLDYVAVITRAIFNEEAINCTYISSNSKKHSPRQLAPLAILNDGKNWIFRAFDRSEKSDNKFKNFNFSRVLKSECLNGDEKYQQRNENISQDNKWNLTLPVALELHPSLTSDDKKTIRNDFGMKPDQDELIIMEKAAGLWILTKQWFIDTKQIPETGEHAAFYKFFLKNRDMLSPYL